MVNFENTDKSRLRRVPERAHYEKEIIYPIIDEALVCHLGFVQDGTPFVIPTIHARMGDELVFHGAKASRLMKYIASGAELCAAITLLDGLVLARSVFHHSMNYRSVVLFGRGRHIHDEDEKLRALELLSEHLMPGRWADARKATTKEMNTTLAAAMSIDSATAKVRTGPPGDEEEDYGLPVWAGVLPMGLFIGAPQNDPRLGEDIPVPYYVANYRR